MPRKLLESEYDDRLAAIGKACRLDKYTNNLTPTLHLCLIHKEKHKARPSDLLQGHGLHCCWNGGNNKDAAKRYDIRLAKLGLVERVDLYQTRRTPIRHRCLRHNRIFLQEPRRALEGRIPPCCGGMWRGSLYAMLLEPQRWNLNSNSVVYLFRLARFPGYVKIGISANIKARIDQEYGDFVCYWTARSRFHAFLVEQASLGDASLEVASPLELVDSKWAGTTEVRKSGDNQAIQVIQFYFDAINRLGPYQFILDYLTPNEAERDLCEQALAETG